MAFVAASAQIGNSIQIYFIEKLHNKTSNVLLHSYMQYKMFVKEEIQECHFNFNAINATQRTYRLCNYACTSHKMAIFACSIWPLYLTVKSN